MLDLDSPKWETLTHAYGTAEDIPGLLREITVKPYSSNARSPWQKLYGSLCHQFCLATAAYAAFPHLITFAEEANGSSPLNLLDLASTIEAERNMPHQPAFPKGLKTAYMSALGRAPKIAAELLSQRWDRQQMRSLLGAIAIFNGHAQLGFSLQASTDEIECFECGNIQPPPYYEEFER